MNNSKDILKQKFENYMNNLGFSISDLPINRPKSKEILKLWRAYPITKAVLKFEKDNKESVYTEEDEYKF